MGLANTFRDTGTLLLAMGEIGFVNFSKALFAIPPVDRQAHPGEEKFSIPFSILRRFARAATGRWPSAASSTETGGRKEPGQALEVASSQRKFLIPVLPAQIFDNL